MKPLRDDEFGVRTARIKTQCVPLGKRNYQESEKGQASRLYNLRKGGKDRP